MCSLDFEILFFFISCLKPTQRLHIFRVLCTVPYGEVSGIRLVPLRSVFVLVTVLRKTAHTLRYWTQYTCMCKGCPQVEMDWGFLCGILININLLPCPVLQSWIVSSVLQANFKQAFPPFACSFKSTKHYLGLVKCNLFKFSKTTQLLSLQLIQANI